MCKLSEVISPSFFDVHRAIKNGTVGELVLKGGRGSTKSSYASIELILQLILHPECHAVVLRKVANTLRGSVYAQCCWAIDVLGLSDKFRRAISPMAITYKPTGQQILFAGLDDPGKIKSIKVPFGYPGSLWFEELDQFAGPEEVRNAEQSVLRGGSYSLCIKSFNPPAMARNWANRYALEDKPGKLVHHSVYTEVPPEWLGPRFIADAAYLQETKPIAYRHEYLGEVVGCGTQVFDNIHAEPIPDALIAVFDRRLHGVDWGYYPDPWAYNAVYYDAARRTLYIYDELTRHRASNQETARLLLDRQIEVERLTADSAEPKSIGDYKSAGLFCRGARKGPGSVEYSHKWLQSLDAIVIDPQRCPDTYQEFSEYEYERDKAGDVVPGYPDLNNHHIDAVRYATEPIWYKRGAGYD